MTHTQSYASRYDAVSPVVGVMLMLVVTIIIAAVVSAFAGGLTSGQKSAPTMSADIHILNSGTWTDTSGFTMTVTSVSEPIPTKDLRITTSWTASDGTTGGAIIVPWDGNWAHCNYQYGAYSGPISAGQAPWGFGAGVNQSTVGASITTSYDGTTYKATVYPDQFFGNYTFITGTMIKNTASSAYGNSNYGSTFYQYGNYSSYTYGLTLINGALTADGPQSLLGQQWNHLRPGDIVTVKITHTPSGKVILDKNIAVEA